MKISTFGAGYVGLVTSSCLAELGNRVVCCDTSTEKIQKLRAGQIPFFEPGLEELAFRNQKAGRLAFTTDPKEAIEQSEIIFIAVGTPSLPDGSADVSAVFNVAKSIGQFLKNDRVIIVTKSTVSLGTTPKVRGIIKKALEKRGLDLEFAVVNNPEFLRQGRAVEDSMVEGVNGWDCVYCLSRRLLLLAIANHWGIIIRSLIHGGKKLCLEIKQIQEIFSVTVMV